MSSVARQTGQRKLVSRQDFSLSHLHSQELHGTAKLSTNLGRRPSFILKYSSTFPLTTPLNIRLLNRVYFDSRKSMTGSILNFLKV